MRHRSRWIHDLSAQDPRTFCQNLMGNVFFIQKVSPTTVTDPMQQKIMTFMPVIFTVFFCGSRRVWCCTLYRQRHGHHHSAAAGS